MLCTHTPSSRSGYTPRRGAASAAVGRIHRAANRAIAISPSCLKIGGGTSKRGAASITTPPSKEGQKAAPAMLHGWGEHDRPSPTRTLTIRPNAKDVVATAAAVAASTVDYVDDAAPAAKAPVETPGALVLRSACHYLPHPDKVHYGGEDAHFISTLGGGSIGVADGVGGWQESGINPAEYSRTLMQMASAYIEGTGPFANENRSQVLIDPRGALHAAHTRTKVAGSATACVMQLDQNKKTLVAANLGDSGFLVIRQGRVFARSKPLQHYFDCPLQFGAFPEYVEATDTADMADLYRVPLHPGDVVIAGSDGLWDNVFDHEIISIVADKNADPASLAKAICVLARKHASDPDFASPYTREALSQGYDLPWWDKLFGASFKNGRFQLRQLTGGKQDDITVLVAKAELS